MTTTLLRKNLYRVERDDISYLGIRVSAPKVKLSSQLAGIRAAKGDIVAADGARATWGIEGVFQHPDGLIVYGPYLDVTESLDDLLDSPAFEAVERLSHYLACFLALEDELRATEFVSSAVLRLANGSVLVLPLVVRQAMMQLTIQSERFDTWGQWHDPWAPASAPFAHSLSLFLLSLATSHRPSSDGNEEVLWNRYASRLFRRPEFCVGNCPAILRDAYARRFSKTPGECTLQEVASMSASWLEVLKSPGEPKEDDLRQFRREEKGYARKLFLREHRITLGVAGAAAILVLAVVFGVVGQALKPPLSLGWESSRVVSTYYEAWSKLDTQTMDDLCKGTVLGQRIDAATNLYVVSKYRESQEMRNVVISPSVFNRTPNKAALTGMILFGIDALDIKKVSETEQTTIYETSYQYWMENLVDPYKPIVPQKVTEQLTLVRNRDAWQISEIREISGNTR